MKFASQQSEDIGQPSDGVENREKSAVSYANGRCRPEHQADEARTISPPYAYGRCIDVPGNTQNWSQCATNVRYDVLLHSPLRVVGTALAKCRYAQAPNAQFPSTKFAATVS